MYVASQPQAALPAGRAHVLPDEVVGRGGPPGGGTTQQSIKQAINQVIHRHQKGANCFESAASGERTHARQAFLSLAKLIESSKLLWAPSIGVPVGFLQDIRQESRHSIARSTLAHIHVPCISQANVMYARIL